MANVRAAARGHHYWLPSARLAWLTVGLLSLVAIIGCRSGGPVVNDTPPPSGAAGTISGTVRGPGSTSAVDGRIVEAVNVATRERHRATTSPAGGFTLKVAPGTYRIELTLRAGESLVKQPGLMNVNRSDADAPADFVIGGTHVSRPRGPAYRTDHGLRGPIA